MPRIQPTPSILRLLPLVAGLAVPAAALLAQEGPAPAEPGGASVPDPAPGGTGVDPTRLLLDMIDRQIGGEEKAATEIHPALQALLLADYLSDDERRTIRIEHGLWEDADLAAPADRARAALIAGAVTADVFDDPAVPAAIRADAMLARGEPDAALALLGDADSLHATRIRAQSLFDLARFDDADRAVQAAVDRLLREKLDDADELAEGVRALMIRARIRGSERAAGGDFRTLKRIIESGRDTLDALSWRIRLVEAELLYEKHNLQGAAEAIEEVVARNPRCAAAKAMIAHLSVNSFAFDQAEAIVADLRESSERLGGVNPHAAIIEARMRLRQRDPDAALEILAPARDALPTHRGLLAWHAAAEAAAFDPDASERLLARLDELSPGTPLGFSIVGEVLSEARQYDEAIGALAVARERLPAWSSPAIEQGLVLIQAGRDAEAERALARAVELDPFNARARNSLELVRGLATFDSVRSDHFIVRYAPPADGQPAYDAFLAREMLPVLEDIHARVCADPTERAGGIGHEPADRTLIEIMPSHAWFSVRITGMTRIHTMAAATGPIIAMESPREGPGFTVGPFDWPRVLQHEYTHTVTLSKTRNRIPHWFTEATAVFCEDAPRDESTWRLLARAYETGTLFDLAVINTAFIRPKKPTDRGQAYAQGHWMVQFIVDRWGPAMPTALMDRYAAGEREASAFEAELGISTDAFMEAFLEWAAEDLRRVGLLPPEDAPTIPEMLEADRREAVDADAIQPDAAFLARWSDRYPAHPQLAELAVSIAMEDADPRDARLPEDVIGVLRRLTERVPIAETPHRLLARHFLAGGGDDRVEAIPHLTFLDAREQNSATYAMELATLHAQAGHADEALRCAERAARVSPFDADTREFAARVALKAALDGDRSRFADAERHIEALTVIEPGVERHAMRLARIRALAEQ